MEERGQTQAPGVPGSMEGRLVCQTGSATGQWHQEIQQQEEQDLNMCIKWRRQEAWLWDEVYVMWLNLLHLLGTVNTAQI